MRSLPAHDPLEAIAETEVGAEVASLFADIRETMGIPMVTSIWRLLASMEGALASVWAATRPMVRSGAPEAALASLRAAAAWPTPLRTVDAATDIGAACTLLDAYDRANSLTLLALGAVVAEPSGRAPETRRPDGPAWPPLPALRGRDGIDASTWQLIEAVNRLGATQDQPGIATLWRHLADWPCLLAAIVEAFEPLEAEGTLRSAIEWTLAWCRRASADIATIRPQSAPLPREARATVERYVTHPGLVVRMVVIGHAVSAWLEGAPTGAR